MSERSAEMVRELRRLSARLALLATEIEAGVTLTVAIEAIETRRDLAAARELFGDGVREVG